MDNGSEGGTRAGRWVSFREALAYLGINEGTLRKRLGDGLVEGKKIHGPNGPEWRVCLPLAEGRETTPSPPHDLGATDPLTTAGDPPATSPLPTDALLVLWREHQAASYRIGYLEAQLAGLPALTEGAAAAAAWSAELEARAKDAERELLRAAALHAAERRRGRAWAVGAIVLAVLVAGLAVGLGGMLLARRPAGYPETASRVRNTPTAASSALPARPNRTPTRYVLPSTNRTPGAKPAGGE